MGSYMKTYLSVWLDILGTTYLCACDYFKDNISLFDCLGTMYLSVIGML